MPEHHGNWKGDDAQPATGRWRARRWFPMRPGQVCAECEVRPARERHHWDGNPLNNDRNVVFLCRRCHLHIDGRDRQGRLLQGRPAQPHCKAGHPLTPDNSYIAPDGRRRCRICRRERWRESRARTRG